MINILANKLPSVTDEKNLILFPVYKPNIKR